MINRKELKLFWPMINCYPEFGHLFSLLDVNDPLVETWVINNFLHFFCFKDRFVTFKDHWTLIKNCPFFELTSIQNISELKYNTSLDGFIEEAIDNGYYIILNINRYYISDVAGHVGYPCNHLIMVNGYDSNKGSFLVSDNSAETGKYCRCEYAIKEVITGYDHLIIDNVYSSNIIKLRPIKVEKCTLDYQFDIRYYVKQLLLFVNTKWLSFYKDAFAYDLDAIQYEIEQLIEDQGKDFDIRRIYLYYEHIHILCFDMDYLIKNSYLNLNSNMKEEYNLLKEEYRLILNLAIKYNLKQRQDSLEKVIFILSNNVLKEKELIKTLADHLIKTNLSEVNHNDLF